VAQCRWSLAVGLLELGDPAAAIPQFRRALAGGPTSGRNRAILLADYAEALVEHGHHDQAAAALTDAEQIVTRIGDEVGAGRIRTFRADLAIADRDWPTARAHLDAALKTLTTHNDTNGRIHALRRLGDVAIGEGHAERATRILEQTLQLTRKVGARAETARALARLAIAAHLQGDLTGARHHRHECQRILTDLELPASCLRLPGVPVST
jgi:tetratricopeptide (TPR) repeat protein